MLSVNLKGRTGNQIFQYVMIRILADMKDTDFNLNKNWLGKNIFPSAYTGIKKNTKLPNIFNEGSNRFNKEVFDIKDNTLINGYWQSEKYFLGYEDKIKNEWLKINDTETKDKCVIHYRCQDDYLHKNITPNIDYFNRSIKYVKDISPNIEIVVITDNVEISKKLFPFTTVKKQNEVYDFIEIYESRYKIISNSSFSWWGAWLNLENSEVVIAPDRWMNHNFNKFKQNIFYPHDIKTKKFIYL